MRGPRSTFTAMWAAATLRSIDYPKGVHMGLLHDAAKPASTGCAGCTGNCACKTKSPEKVIEEGSPCYTANGITYSIHAISAQIAVRMKHTFGEFALEESATGELVIRTGMRRDKPSAAECKQPCSGDCEACPASSLV